MCVNVLKCALKFVVVYRSAKTKNERDKGARYSQ